MNQLKHTVLPVYTLDEHRKMNQLKQDLQQISQHYNYPIRLMSESESQRFEPSCILISKDHVKKYFSESMKMYDTSHKAIQNKTRQLVKRLKAII